MKKSLLLITLFSVITCFSQKDESKSVFGNEMSEIMQHMKAYTLAIASQMPDNKYDFRPSKNDSVRAFAEQLKHLVFVNNQQAEYLLKARQFDVQEFIRNMNAFEQTDMKKEEIIVALSQSYEKLIRRINEMTDKDFDTPYKLPFIPAPKSLRVMVMFVRDHNSHHRAQLVSYLRMNDIKPAAYQPF